MNQDETSRYFESFSGHGRMGAVVPGAQSKFRRTFVRKVEKGDVIALPKGTVYWWYNDGNETHRVLSAGDTTFGANPGRFHQFGLARSKQARFGSVLHGFSHETLATAWGVDQQTIKTLLSRQNAAGIVKAKQKIQFQEMPYERRQGIKEEEGNALEYFGGRRSTRSSSYFEELKYSIRSERPDFFVENGGWISIVNYNKLPALRQVGFSAVKVSLEKQIWDEVGESDAERDQMLSQLEQECLQVYRRKVDQASNARARLLKALADSEAELTSLISHLGDRSILGRSEKRAGTLKEQLSAVQPQLDELRQKQEERMRQFIDVKARIEQITAEILGLVQNESSAYSPASEEDLSVRRLDEYHSQLQALQKEKSERLHKVLDYVGTVHELCAVLGMDFFKTVTEVHPSLDDSISGQSKSISNDTLDKLAKTVASLKQEKKQRIKKLQDLGTSLIEMWSLMDTPSEEQQLFQHVTCILSMSEEEVSAPQALALDNIEQAEVEVERLDTLKASKTKELVMKKQEELDEIYRQAHMDPDPNTTHEKIMAIIDSGMFDPSELLASMDLQISKAKEEALSRRDIMEKVEKWMSACEEESWLEDYSRDQNRYNATRGAHLNLKRAERARVTVNKLPALVDSLVAKTQAWEEEHDFSFVYDGVRLLDMLEEYNLLRQEKEDVKRRARDHKKLQEQLQTEQETYFGSRPSPNKPVSAKKPAGSRMNGSVDMPPANRRLSLAAGGMLQSGNADMLIPRVNGVTPVRIGKDGKRERARPAAPANFVALTKEDSISIPSANGSPDPASPIAV